MKLFTDAIAPIVDANTGYGLPANRNFIDPRAAVRRAHRIRSNSVHGLVASIRAAIGAGIERLRVRTQERRELTQLKAMSDRLLDDIGLTRGDLIAVELGITTLAEIYAARRDARGRQPHTAAATALLEQSGEAANESHYRAQNCA